MRAFVFSLYLSSTGSSNLLSAAGMQQMTRDSVAQHMQLNIRIEKPHPTIPAITVGEIGGPHLEFVELVTSVMNETGGILQGAGYPNLGTFVLEALKEAGRVDANALDPDFVIQRLIQALPAFRDMWSDDEHCEWVDPSDSTGLYI